MIIRYLMEKDFQSIGFHETLSALKPTPFLPYKNELIYLERMRKEIYTLVAAENDEIIGMLSYFREPKYYHDGKDCVHVEDVAVHPKHQGRGIGRMLVEELKKKIEQEGGAYKIILYCAPHNIEFYKKLGFRVAETQMRLDVVEREVV